MKQVYLIAVLLSFSAPAFATKIINPVRNLASENEVKCSESGGDGMDVDYIVKQAEKAQTCDQAAKAVESCGFGSSQDVITCAAAAARCEKFTKKLSSSDRNLKKMMIDRCAKTCNQETDGTLCRATQAFCRLDAVKFIYSVNAEGN